MTLKTPDLAPALLDIDQGFALSGKGLIDVGREIYRRNGTEYHWRDFAVARGMSADVAYRLWEEFKRSPDGPDVIERMLPEGWEPPAISPWDAIRNKDAVSYVAEHVIAPPVASIGIGKVDAEIGGITAGTYTVVGGEGGAGKTALAMNCAYAAATGDRYLPLVYSAEVSAKECYDRILAIHSRAAGLAPVYWSLTHEQVEERMGDADSWRLWNATGYARRNAVDAYVKRFGTVDPVLVAYDDFMRRYGQRIAIRDTGISCDVICDEVRELTKLGVKVLPIIDHIHAIEPPGGTKDGEYEAVSAISGALMQLAKECRIPMLVLSELRNIGEKERDEPRLGWFRGSGRIGYDAGCAIVLMQDGERDRDGQPVLVNVIKNRRGATGARLKVTFSGAAQSFR